MKIKVCMIIYKKVKFLKGFSFGNVDWLLWRNLLISEIGIIMFLMDSLKILIYD